MVSQAGSDVGLRLKLDDINETEEARSSYNSPRVRQTQRNPSNRTLQKGPRLYSNFESSAADLEQPQQSNPVRTNWKNVVLLANEQNKRMYGNERKKMKSKEDVGLPETSLLCLSLKNPFRKACIKIVEWK